MHSGNAMCPVAGKLGGITLNAINPRHRGHTDPLRGNWSAPMSLLRVDEAWATDISALALRDPGALSRGMGLMCAITIVLHRRGANKSFPDNTSGQLRLHGWFGMVLAT